MVEYSSRIENTYPYFEEGAAGCGFRKSRGYGRKNQKETKK